MLSPVLTLVILMLTLALFCWVGLRVGADRSVEEFAVARNSQTGNALGLSFFASGVGSWILFSAPEVGAQAGIAGAVGYAAGVVLPLVGLVLVGTRLRARMPQGFDLAQFVRGRFGPLMQVYVILISLVYMFTALAAELTAVSSVLGRISGLSPAVGILAMAVVTAAYTAFGGLRASIRTDLWHAWMLVGLAAVIGGYMILRVLDVIPGSPVPGAAQGSAGQGNAVQGSAGQGSAGQGSPGQGSGAVDPTANAPALADLLSVDRAGIEAGITVAIAVTATTLFHNGYWQRVWSARDSAALRRGAVIGSLTRFPLVLAAGLTGVFAVWLGLELGTPPAPFFALLAGSHTLVLIAVLVFTLALIASTLDTLQTGISALIVTRAPRLGLTGARVLTVLATAIPAVIAFQGFSVLRLFLIADLFCAATLIPVLLGLWKRTSTAAAVTGSIVGLASTYAYGLVTTGFDAAEALAVATFAHGLTLGPFAAALLASAAVTLVFSLFTRTRTRPGTEHSPTPSEERIR